MEEILQLKNIAVVGFSTDPGKPSHTVPKYLIEQGYTVFPVNPNAEEILGQKSYPNVPAIPDRVDIVVVFRPSLAVPKVAETVFVRDDVRVLWLQEGISHQETAEQAESRGMTVVQDRCIYKEHKKLQLG